MRGKIAKTQIRVMYRMYGEGESEAMFRLRFFSEGGDIYIKKNSLNIIVKMA